MKEVSYDVNLFKDHVLINDRGKWLLIDTGAGPVVADYPVFDFCGRKHNTVRDYYGFNTEGLTNFVGHRIDALVGVDALYDTPFKLDLNKMKLTFRPDGEPFTGALTTPLVGSFGAYLPKVDFKFNGRRIQGILDTGCPVSYMPQEEGRIVGEADDFFPSYGTWTTDLWENDVELVNRKFKAKFGMVPATCILRYSAPWLLGAEFLKSGPMGFDLRRQRLHLFSNN